MPVNAQSLVRKMRGGAQAHLLQCDDGRFYVVKFRNNPQHRRILVNEWISGEFLRYLGIAAPDTAIVHCSQDFLAGTPEVHIQLGTTRQDIRPGWHFGSLFPGDPGRMIVYDFLPDLLLDKIANVRDFHGILVFDKWMGNADARQSIFFRAQLRAPHPANPATPVRAGFVAHMMDHGFVFDGPHWTFSDSPIQGLYFRHQVYRSVRSWDDFQPWLDRVVHFPEEVVDSARKQLPPEWIEDDENALDKLLMRLLHRRARVEGLLAETLRARPASFPNWTAELK